MIRHARSATPGLLPSLKPSLIREICLDTVASFGRFGIALWASLPRVRTSWDFHRSVSSAIVQRRNHQTPRFSPEAILSDAVSFLPDEFALRTPRFRTLQSLALSPGRNVIPPLPIRLGPFVAVSYLSTLAAYPAVASSRRIFPTVTDLPG